MVNKDSRILIFMCDDRSTEEETYVKYCVLINKIYAKKHDYDFSFVQTPKLPDKHSAWSKVDVCINQITNNTNYDIYVYIDSDCFFNKQNISIYEYLNNNKLCRNDTGSNIVFSRDSIGQCLPCSGFFIFNSYALQIFIDWKYNHSEEDKIYYTKHSWEQMVLQKKIDRYYIKVINDNYFRLNYNNFIMHLAFKPHDYRLRELKKYYFDMIRTEKIDIYTEIFTTTKNDS